MLLVPRSNQGPLQSNVPYVNMRTMFSNMTDLDDQLGVRKSGVKENPEKSKFCGRFTLSLSKTNNRGIGISDDKVLWHDKKRDRMKVPVADLFVFAIRRYSHAHGYTNEFKVMGYTTYMIKKDSDEESVSFTPLNT
jgi:hypothetical protein